VIFRGAGNFLTPDVAASVVGEGSTLLRAGMGGFAVEAAVARGLYVNSVTADGIDVMHGLMLVTSGITSTIRVGVAQGGGFINVLVINQDGQPLPDTGVHTFRAEQAMPAVLAQSRVATFSGPDGSYLSDTLAPGKYYVVASDSPVDNTPECIARLWTVRNKATMAEVSANATVQVTVKPVTIE
jgi:hypothetical protein